MDEQDCERLPVRSGDMRVVRALISLTKRMLAIKTIRPAQVVGLGRALYALGRLPVLTPGVMVDYDVSVGGGDAGFGETRYWSITISGYSLEVKSGGSVYQSGVGGDSYSGYTLELCASGYRHSGGDFDEWLAGAEEALSLWPQLNVTDDSGDVGMA